MHVCRLTRWLILACLLPTACAPTVYNRLIIDTYKPTGGGSLGTTDTFLSLFDASGEAGLPLAEDDNGNPTYVSAARIDYTPPVGITSGTVLYVRVKATTSDGDDPYAIRLVTSVPDPDSYNLSWFFAAAADADDDLAYEPDDATTGGVPDAPVSLTVDQKYNRFLSGTGDVDWFQLVLP
jgi:hypothetical protein